MAERELAGIQYDNGDEHDMIVEQLRNEAESGSVEAMNRLGKMYIDGDGVDRNEEEAAEWFYQSASLGDTLGLLMMGNMYLEGTGVSQNEDLARENLEKAAAQGSKEAGQLLDRMDARLSEAQKKTENPEAGQREAGTAGSKAALRDPWEEQMMSRGEMVSTLREASMDFMKKEELERQERSIVVPVVIQTGNSRKKLPGKARLAWCILAGIVTFGIWINIYRICDNRVENVWEMLMSLPVELSDGPEPMEIVVLGQMFIPPVLFLIFLIGWIRAVANSGKNGENEAKRLNEAQADQAKAQKKLLMDKMNQADKSAREKLSFLPARYQSAAACEALAQLFEDRRADSLKEALNIYSLERSGGGEVKPQKVSRRGL